MVLTVIGSGSSGNCYLLQSEDEVLIIECGVSFKEIKKGLNLPLSSVVGCLVSHEHQDHSKSMKELIKNGIDVFSSNGTFQAMGINADNDFVLLSHHRQKVGSFGILPFNIQHDCVEPLGFLIHHPEMGLCLFATDTYYLKYTFPGLNQIIIEANYCEDIVAEKKKKGTHQFADDRVIKSHMSIQNCGKMLEANDLTSVNNIVLIHLSDRNSHEIRFKQEVEQLTGKNVHIALKGLEIDFNLKPF